MRRLLGQILLLAVLGSGFLKAEEVMTVGTEELSAAIKAEFAEQGIDEAVELEYYGGQVNFAFPGQGTPKIMISNLKADELQNKFNCRAEIFADGKFLAATTISGKFFLLGEAYVPARHIAKGEIITESLLREITVRTNRIKADHVVEKERLLNKEAKRSLKEGKLIAAKEIGPVMVIKKGDVVTSVYETGGLQITAKVEALSDGGKGDKIEVMNTKSKKTLMARVVDANTVAVDAQ